MVLVNQAEPSTRKLISVPPLMPPSIDGRFPFSHFLKELRPEWSEAADRRKVQNSLQTFNEALVVQGIAGTQKASWTTAVTVIPATSLFQFPPNYFQINKALRFTIAGSIGNVVTAQPTFTFQVMIGDRRGVHFRRRNYDDHCAHKHSILAGHHHDLSRRRKRNQRELHGTRQADRHHVGC
jgi:hypothetical protein